MLVIFVGGYLAYRYGLSVEDVFSFILYLSLFYAPVSGLAQMLENLQQALAGAERVALILDTPSQIVDAKDAVKLENVEGSISFEHCFLNKQGMPLRLKKEFPLFFDTLAGLVDKDCEK